MDNVQAGQTIGPYRIIQQVGQGGMATVYKAYQPAMERYVALKILPRQLADSPEFVGRFQQEARLIAHLEHAHILPVHDYGRSDGYTYLAMRFIEAGTLSDRLRGKPLSDAEIDRWFTQLADALDYAHAQGVVHRDLKPSNVLLDTRGDVFLTDFGIAKLLEADKRFTGSGAMIGTPAYMSPEQGMGSRVDRRTDIYSLGIMLYEMVTGQVPFDADTPLAIVLKQINDPLPLPSRLNPSLSPAQEQVLLKALAKDPEARYATAGQFSAAWLAARHATLRQSASGLPAPGQPPTGRDATSVAALPAAPASRRWLGRFTLLAAGATLLAAVLVCGGVLAAFFINQQRQAGQPRLTPPPGTTLGAAGPATQPASPVAGTAPAGTAVAVGAANTTLHWHSWSAANTVVAVALFNGQLVSGGPGGLTRWNLSDSSVAGRLTTGNGLPDPDVNVLLVDDQPKRLWIGTDQGLAAFDGQTTQVYNKSNGLDGNTINAVAHTKHGLLVGTADSGTDGGGLNLLVNDRWQPVTGFPSAADTSTTPDKLSATVRAILEDSQGVLWIGTTNGLGRFDGQTWNRFSTADGLPDNEITTLLEAKGVIWVGTNSGLARWDGKTLALVPDAKGQAILGMFLAANGDIWFTGESGMARLPAAGGALQSYDQSQVPAGNLYGGVTAPGGTLYFGSDAGVLRFDGRTFDLLTVPNLPSQPAYQIIVSGPTAGTLWFARVYSSRTDLVDTATGNWAPGPVLDCDNSCIPLARGPDGRLWAAGNEGMWVFQGKQASHITKDQGLPAGSGQAVAFAGDGSIWIGTPAGAAVYRGTGVTTVYTSTNAGLADDSVNHLLAGADGSVWVATANDLSRHLPDGQWIHYGPGNPFQSDVSVNSLAQDASGAIWVATDGEGVYRFANNVWTQFRPGVSGVKLPSNDVLCVTPAADGSVWFGTYQAGVARFDGTSWQAYTVADGLVDATVYAIYVDKSGTAWFATAGGVSSAARP